MEIDHQQKIRHFLKQLNIAINNNDIYRERRDKNIETFEKFSLNDRDVLNIIKRMKIDDYIRGPEPDDKGRPGEIWIFKLKVSNKILYVKFCSTEKGQSGPIRCISFHENGI